MPTPPPLALKIWNAMKGGLAYAYPPLLLIKNMKCHDGSLACADPCLTENMRCNEGRSNIYLPSTKNTRCNEGGPIHAYSFFLLKEHEMQWRGFGICLPPPPFSLKSWDAVTRDWHMHDLPKKCIYLEYNNINSKHRRPTIISYNMLSPAYSYPGIY
jgi:hypothetical protein